MEAVRAVLVQQPDLFVQKRALLVIPREAGRERSFDAVLAPPVPDDSHSLALVVAGGEPDLAPHAGECVRHDQACNALRVVQREPKATKAAERLPDEQRSFDLE